MVEARVKNTARDRAFVCERCSGKMLYDGENLSCLMCGYESLDDERVRRGRVNPGEMLDALVRFRSELSHFVEAIGPRVTSGSPAERELAQLENDDAVAHALVPNLAYQSVFASGHALIALARGLEPPAPEYGTWATSNAVLQATGLVNWLLDPSISAAERALRALAIEDQELTAEAQVMLGMSGGQQDAQGPFANAIASNRARAAQLASQLGIDVPSVPNSDELASYLECSAEQRMFASIVAGRPWALLQATAMASSLGAHPSGAVAAIQVATTAAWYARAAWTFARWMLPTPGADLVSTLERGYDSIGLPEDERTRFWRTAAVAVPVAEPRRPRGTHSMRSSERIVRSR
ncbi:MAG: hypothetical protein DWI48_02175 [Chloroflexi bacterium]|nr:MAG: hypothetical protein DWI48_02175 [Chloroflexota bacterium]